MCSPLSSTMNQKHGKFIRRNWFTLINAGNSACPPSCLGPIEAGSYLAMITSCPSDLSSPFPYLPFSCHIFLSDQFSIFGVCMRTFKFILKSHFLVRTAQFTFKLWLELSF